MNFFTCLEHTKKGAMKQGRCSTFQPFLVTLPNVPCTYYIHWYMCTYHRVIHILHVPTYLLALHNFQPRFITPTKNASVDNYQKYFGKLGIVQIFIWVRQKTNRWRIVQEKKINRECQGNTFKGNAQFKRSPIFFNPYLQNSDLRVYNHGPGLMILFK